MFNQLIKPVGFLLKMKDVDIYRTVFKIHTKLTVLILFWFSALVSSYEIFGKPIYCIVGNKENKLFVESLCWVNGTYTIRQESKLVEGIQITEMVFKHQKYYQWVIVVLALEAFFSYIPAYLWKCWEHNRMEKLCGPLGSRDFPNGNQKEIDRIISYFRADNRRIHTVYFFKFVFCEFMNFGILVFNMWFLDVIFNGFWTRYYPSVKALFLMDGELFSNLANDLFPKVTKCTYSFYGPSGTAQLQDAHCLLSLNIINEKIFAFLYIWMIALLGISSLNLIFRIFVLASSSIRSEMIHTLASSSTTNIVNFLAVISIGDWFILYQLGRNINATIFTEILYEIAQ